MYIFLVDTRQCLHLHMELYIHTFESFVACQVEQHSGNPILKFTIEVSCSNQLMFFYQSTDSTCIIAPLISLQGGCTIVLN